MKNDNPAISLAFADILTLIRLNNYIFIVNER